MHLKWCPKVINIPVNCCNSTNELQCFLFSLPLTLSFSIPCQSLCLAYFARSMFCFVLFWHTDNNLLEYLSQRHRCVITTTCRHHTVAHTLSQRVLLLLFFFSTVICNISYKNNNHNDNVTAIKTMSKNERINVLLMGVYHFCEIYSWFLWLFCISSKHFPLLRSSVITVYEHIVWRLPIPQDLPSGGCTSLNWNEKFQRSVNGLDPKRKQLSQMDLMPYD